MKHIISILIENESGALSRVSGLFSARGYNIKTLTVAPTEDKSLSRLTLTSNGSEQQIEKIVKHLNRLIDVIKVIDLTECDHVETELMLVKLTAVGEMRAEFVHLAEIFKGKIVDVSSTVFIVELVGKSNKLDAFLDNIDSQLILETVRSGSIGLARGERSLKI